MFSLGLVAFDCELGNVSGLKYTYQQREQHHQPVHCVRMCVCVCVWLRALVCDR